MFYTVSRENPNEEKKVREEIKAFARARTGSSVRPLFIMVRAINQFDRAEDPTPRTFALAFTEENLEAVLKLSYEPESAWEAMKASEIGSDIAYKVIQSHENRRVSEDYPDLWEITHFGLYDSRTAELPRDATIRGYFYNAIELFPLLRKNGQYTGHFFKYKLNKDIVGDNEKRLLDQFRAIPGLKERFQIDAEGISFNELNEENGPIENSVFSIPCMVYALKRQGVCEQALNEIMQNGHNNGNFKLSSVIPVLEKYKYRCRIRRIQSVEERFKVNYNERGYHGEDLKYIDLIFWEEHWMSGENVWWQDYNGKRGDVSFIRVLEECKRKQVLVPLDAYELAQSYNCYSYDQMLEFDTKTFLKNGKNKELIKQAYELPVYKDKKAPPVLIGFADFEACTDDMYHQPYSVVLNWLDDGDKMYYYEGGSCVENFIRAIIARCMTIEPRSKGIEARIYFYNLKYDWSFFNKYVHQVKSIENGNKLYSLKCEIGSGNNKARVEFWDFLPITMCSLKNAAKAYLSPDQQASIKKEYIPYSFYTKERVKGNNSTVKLDEFIDAWANENKCELVPVEVAVAIKEAAIQAGAYDSENKMVDYMKYNQFYNEQDVRILRNIAVNLSKLFAGGPIEGINGENNPIALNLWSYRTASSIGYDYFWRHCIVEKTSEGWKPRYNIALPKMQLRYIIQKSIRGGRVMVRDNEKIRYDAAEHNGILICDYDGVSLYPSAMSKLWITEGEPELIKGKFNTEDFKQTCTLPETDVQKTYKDMIVHVTMINTAKKRHFPLLCVKNSKTGLNEYRNFDNEQVDLWVNAIDLWNLIDYQDAQFEYDAAIVWQGERHYEIRTMIQDLFNFRLNNKKHPIQAVAKLMMNSIYGKSTMKTQKTERQYIDKMGWRKDDNGWMPVDKWNEWFSANAYRVYSMDNYENMVKVDTFYRDCSSCFNIFGSNVLAMARRIIGRVMALIEDVEEEHPEMSPGLFYTDTDSMHVRADLLELSEQVYKQKYGEDIKGSQLGQFHVDFEPVNGKNTKGARKCIFLGKKMYADELVNDDGEIGYHYRMKGIPNKALEWKHYETIWNNENVEFNLLDYGPSFFYDHGKVGSRRVMTRKIGINHTSTEEYVESVDSAIDENETITVLDEATIPETIEIRDENDHFEAELLDGIPQRVKRTKLDEEIEQTESYDLNKN